MRHKKRRKWKKKGLIFWSYFLTEDKPEKLDITVKLGTHTNTHTHTEYTHTHTNKNKQNDVGKVHIVPAKIIWTFWCQTFKGRIQSSMKHQSSLSSNCRVHMNNSNTGCRRHPALISAQYWLLFIKCHYFRVTFRKNCSSKVMMKRKMTPK